MTEYHVGCDIDGIYAGTLTKDGKKWLQKSNVTREALRAVAERMFLDEKEYRFEMNNVWYVMRAEPYNRPAY